MTHNVQSFDAVEQLAFRPHNLKDAQEGRFSVDFGAFLDKGLRRVERVVIGFNYLSWETDTVKYTKNDIGRYRIRAQTLRLPRRVLRTTRKLRHSLAHLYTTGSPTAHIAGAGKGDLFCHISGRNIEKSSGY